MNIQMPGDDDMETETPPPPKTKTPPPPEPEQKVSSHIAGVRKLIFFNYKMIFIFLSFCIYFYRI